MLIECKLDAKVYHILAKNKVDLFIVLLVH